MTHRIREDTPRTLLLALAIWAIASVVAALEGVFTKLTIVELSALGLFAFAFALATSYVDRAVRGYLLGASTRGLMAFVLEMDVGIAVGTLLALGLSDGNVAAALTRFPLAVVIVLALPVAAVGHVLLAERLLRRRPARVSSRVALSR